MDLESYDVEGGTMQGLYHDGSHWATVSAFFSSSRFRGGFKRGTNMMDMILGILKPMLATIYPNNLGQIGLWHLAPDEFGDTTVVVSGDPTDDHMTILRGSQSTRRRDLVNIITFEYKNIGDTTNEAAPPDTGQYSDATWESKNQASIDTYRERPKVLSTKWAVDSSLIESQGNRFITRYKDPFEIYRIRGTLVHIAGLELADVVSITEPTLDEVSRPAQVTEITIDPIRNETDLVVNEDPVIVENFCIVDVGLVDTDKIW
jgi:hypothetical protein